MVLLHTIQQGAQSMARGTSFFKNVSGHAEEGSHYNFIDKGDINAPSGRLE